MVLCFLCRNKFQSFGAFKAHLTLAHKSSEYKTLICAEQNCDRNFQLMSSFRRHLQTHVIESLEDSFFSDLQVENTEDDDVTRQTASPSQNNLDVDVAPLLELDSEHTSFELPISEFIAQLYGNQNLPRKIVDTFIGGLKNCLSQSLVLAVSNQLEELSQSQKIPASCVEVIMNSIRPVLTLPWEKFDTEHKRLKYFEKTFVKPQQVVIGQRLDTVKQDGVTKLVPVVCVQSFISIRHVLEMFFSLEGLLVETLNYMTILKNNPELLNGALENFIQGSYWKEVVQRHRGKIVMPLFLYYDDYETGNVLGSRSGHHKLGAVYLMIPCLPPCRISSLNNIFLFLLFHSSDRVQFGNHVIFRCVIDELNYLSRQGIELDVPGFTGKIYFELGLILGDILGIHSICGFMESFSANFPCRTCKTRRTY